MMNEIPILDRTGLRKFGVSTGFFFIGIFGLLLPWLFDARFVWQSDFPNAYWPWVISGLLWSLALIVPKSLGPVYKSWMLVGTLLGVVNTRVILAFLFYLLFTPVRVLLQLLGKDPMKRKFDPDVNSYKVRSLPRPKNHFERPF
jgi:hypothetical protein